jgi:acyl-homoserine lactone acylase PvdQ
MPSSAAAEAPVEPYGAHDAGGFRNVLPAGENGLVTAKALTEFELAEQKKEAPVYPPHFTDQLPLYADLLYASPTLTHEQIPSYFKDATFGVAGEVASTESPRSDVTIVRDKAFGVPHIYGSTRGGVMFGAGYAAGEDRLFFIDVVRHAGRADLSSFVGGAAGNRAMDRTQYSFAPYTEADLEFQIQNAGTVYGAAGEQALTDGREYLAGLNAYVEAAKANPNLMPAEYAGLGKSPEPFKLTDLIAEASLIGGLFGSGGGFEVRSALALQALERQFGSQAGKAAWLDFREKNDPEAPTTVQQPFKYETGNPFANKGLALPDPGSVSFAPASRIAPPASGANASAGAPLSRSGEPIPSDGSIGSRLLRQAGHASNWELVSAAHSTNGHPLAVMGPQVGYFVPQVLMEEDLHGPGIDARGAAFPGGNQYVSLGHGRDYAWSATSGEDADTHTFAEVLCQDQFHYLYKGQCLAMEKLEHTNKWTPNASDKTPPGEETLTASRTVHGIVYARGTVKGKHVAFVNDRTTYFHEADSVIGLSMLNDPGFVRSPKRFQQAVSKINFGFNWAYVDAKNIAYYLSGWYPTRAPGTSPDFPIFGTGQFDYRSFEPKLHTEKVLSSKARPHALNPDFLISWNNKPAPSFASATNKYAWGPIYRNQLIRNFVEGDIAGGKQMGLEQLISAMDEAATQDIRMVELWPIIRQVLGSPSSTALKEAIAKLESWAADGGHRRDLTNKDISKPGVYQHNEAITILDAWWPKLLEAEFHDALGSEAFSAVQRMLRFGGPYPGGPPEAPEFQDGWYGYVSKDLRDLLAANGIGAPPPAPYSRVYCGRGSLAACRTALQSSLQEALAVTPAQIYGQGSESPCKENAQASCFDMNRWTISSALSVPPFPFQNRPTFQQAVELTTTVPRNGRSRLVRRGHR